MKCIILAAGQGKRIKKITKDNPKCLIKVNNENLLTRAEVMEQMLPYI